MAIDLKDWANGDTDYIATYNNNNATLEAAVGNLQTAKQDVSAKAQPDGYAALGSDGKVPAGQLSTNLQYKTEKDQPNGYAGLDSGGHVPIGELPIAVQEVAGGAGIDLTGYQLKTAKDQPSGYAGLDSGGKVLVAELPDLSATYTTKAREGVASGVATLDSGGAIPDAQIPSGIARDSEVTSAISSALSGYSPGTAGAELIANKGAASGYCDLDGSAHVPATRLVAGNMPDLSGTYQVRTEKDAASGYCGLDSGGHVPAARLTAANMPAQPVMLPFFYPGKPGNAALMWKIKSALAFTLPASLTGSNGDVGTTPAATTTLNIQVNGTSKGSVSISTGGVVSFTFSTQVDIVAGDVIKLVNQATADTACADISVTLYGTR